MLHWSQRNGIYASFVRLQLRALEIFGLGIAVAALAPNTAIHRYRSSSPGSGVA